MIRLRTVAVGRHRSGDATIGIAYGALLRLSKGYEQEADCHDGNQPENNPHAGVGHHSLPRASAVQI